MRETDRTINSIERLDWNFIRTTFIKNTDPGGSHPMDDDKIPTYLRARDFIFDAMRDILVEIRVEADTIVTKESLIFLSGYALHRAWHNMDKKGSYAREKNLIKDMIQYLHRAFSEKAVWWEKDMPKGLLAYFDSGKLKLGALLNNCPQLLCGFFTTMSFEEI